MSSSPSLFLNREKNISVNILIHMSAVGHRSSDVWPILTSQNTKADRWHQSTMCCILMVFKCFLSRSLLVIASQNPWDLSQVSQAVTGVDWWCQPVAVSVLLMSLASMDPVRVGSNHMRNNWEVAPSVVKQCHPLKLLVTAERFSHFIYTHSSSILVHQRALLVTPVVNEHLRKRWSLGQGITVCVHVDSLYCGDLFPWLEYCISGSWERVELCLVSQVGGWLAPQRFTKAGHF